MVVWVTMSASRSVLSLYTLWLAVYAHLPFLALSSEFMVGRDNFPMISKRPTVFLPAIKSNSNNKCLKLLKGAGLVPLKA